MWLVLAGMSRKRNSEAKARRRDELSVFVLRVTSIPKEKQYLLVAQIIFN